MDIFDLLSLSNGNNSKWIVPVVLFIFIVTSVVSILDRLENFDIIVGWRRRNELWRIFEEYEGIRDFLENLYQEFNLRAGFNNKKLMNLYFLAPSIFSLLLGFFATL